MAAACNWLAGLVTRGLVDEEEGYDMARALAYDLAKSAYKLTNTNQATRISPFKVNRKIDCFLSALRQLLQVGTRPIALASLCICGLKEVYLTTEVQRTQSKELKQEFINQNFYPPSKD